DDQPITIKSASATGLLRKLVFAYGAGTTYNLYYGNESARSPEYDLQNYIDYFAPTGRQEVKLGPQTANAAYVAPRVPEKPLSERYSWLLTTVLVAAVCVVGFLAFRLFKKKS